MEALHEYSKNTYITKENPIGTGILSLNRKSNTTVGEYSSVVGDNNTASGYASSAEGNNTVAASEAQHVQGRYNIEDADGIYAHIVGNGTSISNRSNAHTVDWNGNAYFAGNIKANSFTGNADSATTLSETLPISKGGTNATDEVTARANLGFSYSDSIPITTPTTGAGSVHFVQDTGAPLSIERGGTGASSIEELREKLGFGNIGKACSARGTMKELTLTEAKKMYTTPLDAWVSRTTDDFTFENNGIKCPYTGTVLISAGGYINDKGGLSTGAYVFKNETEVLGYLFPTVSSVTSTIINVAAGDIIYHKMRASSDGSIGYPSNSATQLSIVYLK